jgi:hypothetical protein
MVIAALISSPCLPTAGPISVKSVLYSRQALLLCYPDFFPNNSAGPVVLTFQNFVIFLTDDCCFGLD